MQLNTPPYSQFGLVTDMLAVPQIVRNYHPDVVNQLVQEVRDKGKLFFTGEGSSRLFPTKAALRFARSIGLDFPLHTEAGRQSQEYQLADWAVLALSNSGRTTEVIRLYHQLTENKHGHLYSLTAFADSALEQLSRRGYVLGCGKEGAVAATKSVIEQALFCRALVEGLAGKPQLAAQLAPLADQIEQALTLSIPSEIVSKLTAATTIYFAGRNDGVAEELTLKTNEITRKRSDFLEGTYAVHGIEEIMQTTDVIVVVNPYAESEQKFHDVLVKGVGATVIAISPRSTMFPTITIPDGGSLAGFVELCAGWNLLVEIGIQLGIDVDKPTRARKVGNEFTPG